MTFDSCGNCRKAMAGPSLQLFRASRCCHALGLLQATASAATSKTLETARSYFPCSDLEGFRDSSKLLPLQPPARL